MRKGEQALWMREAGMSNREIAAHFGMPKDSARRLISEERSRKRTKIDHPVDDLRGVTRTPTLNTAWTYIPFDIPLSGVGFGSGTPSTPKPRRHVFIPDTQCKPGEPIDHIGWAAEYIGEHRPDVIVIAGDWWDMASLSSYEERGSAYFEGRRYKDDIAIGNEALQLFEDTLVKAAGPDYKPRKVMLRGNHEGRCLRVLDAEPRLEGVIGYNDFNDKDLGWEIYDYQVPVEIDGLTYCHNFVNPSNQRVYSGNIDTMLRNVGFSFVAGHSPGLKWGRRELGSAVVQIGLVAGSFYQGEEAYRGPQAKSEWRGIVFLNDVIDGDYDVMPLRLDYLRRKFGP